MKIKKYVVLFTTCILTGGILTACGSSSSSSEGAKTTKVVKNSSSAGDKVTALSSSSSSESESTEDESSSDSTESGTINDLQEVGQSVDDEDYGKITLLSNLNGEASKNHGKLSISFSNFQVVKFETKDKDQQDYSDFDKVGKTYYVLKFKMKVTNNDSRKLLLNGLSEVDVNNESINQVAEVEGDDVSDGEGGIAVNPGVTKTVTMEALISADQANSINKLSLTIGSIDNKSYDEVKGEANPINIPIQ